MKDREPAAPASAPDASGFLMPTVGASPQPAPMDPHAVRRQALARGLQLGNLLQVPVVVDHTGWLDRGIEIIYRRESGCAIQACAVRVGSEARDEDVLADGGALGICHKYNEAIGKLRRLAIRLAAVVRDGDIAVVAGSALGEAQQELLGLDALVASRQLRLMGNGVVRLDRLRSEIAFFEERHASLIPVVMAAEQETHPSWDADTQELKTIP